MPPIDPRRTYAALGAFIERRSPYMDPVLPSFGLGSPESDAEVLEKVSQHLAQLNDFRDKREIAEAGRYQQFNKNDPSTLKSEEIDDKEFLHWEFDGVQNVVTKAIRIEYTHTRKKDGRPCTAFILIGFTGDDH